MKKYLLMLIALCCLLTACSAPHAGQSVDAPTAAPTDVETTPETDPTEAPTPVEDDTTVDDAPEAGIVQALPAAVDLQNLTDCTLAVSLEKSGVSVDENGAVKIRVKVYDYMCYDAVEIANLQVGDQIERAEEVLTITALETTDTGLVKINGGLDNGGIELWTNEDGVYFESGYSDMKAWYELGEVELPLAEGFVYVDSSDLDKGEVSYTAEDLQNLAEEDFRFGPSSTTILVTGGAAAELRVVYTP